jgi:hypothetical protein
VFSSVLERPTVSNGAPSAKLIWEAEGIRFTALPPPSVAFEIKPLWESLVGRAPEEVQERPQQGLRNEFGPLLDDHLFIAQHASRVDFILGVHPQKAAGQDTISVGAYERAEQALVEVVKKWLRIAPSLGRIAYAPTLLHRADSVEKTYELLRRFLPKLPLDEGAKNVFWQINRPRQSKVVGGFTINRLSKWSSMTQQRMQFSTAAGEEQALYTGPKVSTHYIRLELDLYTDPIEPLPPETLEGLLDELVSAATEISEKGDVS